MSASAQSVETPVIDTTEREEEEMEEVQVRSTRSSRSIRDIPTRVEFIAGEELDEKGNMKPGDIRMLLAESTGIQTQQTSAASANASIRIQGLDGRYTQILRDGFPTYSGAASGLGLLQTPPLDLKQVEVIKGSASTLYGGGAIAGLVNLISKTPEAKGELGIQLNATTAKGFDASGYYGKRFGWWGTTLFVSHNRNELYDPSGTGFSAIPEFNRYNVTPRLYFYPTERTVIMVGVNVMGEQRTGGDISAIRNGIDTSHRYYERNRTQRISYQFSADHELANGGALNLKSSYGVYQRKITSADYQFGGDQNSSYTEASYSKKNPVADWVVGGNVQTEAFREVPVFFARERDYSLTTLGAFAQSTIRASESLILEAGLRSDWVRDYGAVLLPRASLLYRFSPRLSSRIGAGAGYKAPTIFTEETERQHYVAVEPVSPGVNKLERSFGANGDVNYRTTLLGGAVSMTVNQLLFYTRIINPLLLQDPSYPYGYRLANVDSHIDSKGGETNIRLGYRDFKLFLGYTYTDAQIHGRNATVEQPLTAKHRVNTVLMYELEDKWKLGLEAYYYSPQKLSDGSTGRDYWLCGAMAEKLWEHFSVYVNFENILDVRQTRFESIYTGPRQYPQFRDIYAPLDGFVVNGGVKVRF
jgi:iron complex outermembrane receptor protein